MFWCLTFCIFVHIKSALCSPPSKWRVSNWAPSSHERPPSHLPPPAFPLHSPHLGGEPIQDLRHKYRCKYTYEYKYKYIPSYCDAIAQAAFGGQAHSRLKYRCKYTLICHPKKITYRWKLHIRLKLGICFCKVCNVLLLCAYCTS